METVLFVPVCRLKLVMAGARGAPPTSLLKPPLPRLTALLMRPKGPLCRGRLVVTVQVRALPFTTRHPLLLDVRRKLNFVVLTHLWSTLATRKPFSGASMALFAKRSLGAVLGRRPLSRLLPQEHFRVVTVLRAPFAMLLQTCPLVLISTRKALRMALDKVRRRLGGSPLNMGARRLRKNLGIRRKLTSLIQRVALLLPRRSIITLEMERSRFPKLVGRLTPNSL